MYKRLLLVGAGHAHLEVLRQWKENPLPNVQVCLISPNRYQYYSGMFSGFTEGIYEEEETRVDLRRLTIDACVHRIQKKAARIDVRHKKIICEDGSAYPFDVVSFDIGSGSLPPDFAESPARSVKPNDEFIEQMKELRETPMPLIIGGGAAGTELALSMQAYKEMQGIPGQVRIITSGRILSDAPKWVSTKLEGLLREKGVRVWEQERVQEVSDSHVHTATGNQVRHTGVLWLGGAFGDTVFERSGVEVDERSFAYVRSTLQFEGFDYMFGAGDCVTMMDHPDLPKSGVYAVKQGPVLFNNLRSYLDGKELQHFSPQKNAMYILSTGGKRGFLIYGPLSAHNRQAWKMKHKIDKEFMAKYQ
ncbi:FAD-dependent oxidoreductase [Halobacillus sp. ACCC02827]|uniref:FAD-dependent oxidoreductase n=1 Tax=Bacillaceae TaxID=186817 RepID=UPI0002A4F0EE|nr:MULTISPECIES: FAD-dependent oxidoreductase [Bacillaceae]ELK48702.1 pyridine nucleotide-disulfide oxidoreductase family protein [Halobacillus sp. BAB-2008]QHT45357.1 FAD-dependent oxidoreductase [Bacillus sp. SB49]WJE16142.1 FAD-dependent oxidoreductase [Halobacillus sp. ACCC02827]